MIQMMVRKVSQSGRLVPAGSGAGFPLGPFAGLAAAANSRIPGVTHLLRIRITTTVMATLMALLLLGCDRSTSGEPAGNRVQDQAGAAFDLHDKWSDTRPGINLHHIFLGEINRRGKPTGFHSRPAGQDPEAARVVRIQGKPNRQGVYTAQVEIYDPDNNQWKQKFSSLFPDSLSYRQVVDAILHAYDNRDKGKNQPWAGPSGLGFEIQGYTNNNGSINTAFPIYVRN